MTCAYACQYVSVWLVAGFAYPAAVVLAVFAALGEWRSGEQLVYGCAAAATLLVGLFMHTHSQRVLVRAGAWPNLCSRHDLAPRPGQHTEDRYAAIVDFVQAQRLRFGRPPQVVGSGWGYFLKRAGPPGPRLFMHHLVGRVPGRELTWYAGTTIATVNRDMLQQNRTLWSHPTMRHITIGSWFAAANHGNAGDSGKGNADLFDSADVLDTVSGDVSLVRSYMELRRLFDRDERADTTCVLAVTFKQEAFQKNMVVQKRGFVVDGPHTAAKWLEPGAYLRVVFMGASRSGAIALRWQNVYNETTHTDPHQLSLLTQWLQVDICSVFCGCIASMAAFDGKIKLADANRWTPYIHGLDNVAVVLSGFINYELIFRVDARLDGNALWRLVQEMNAVHYRCGGRSELRFGASQEKNVCYLDMAMRKRHFHEPFRAIKHVLGVNRVALHPGKFNSVSTAPLERATVYEITEAAGTTKWRTSV